MAESTLITQWGSQFLRGNFRLVRNTFNQAGQDSFTDPPMQNPDMFSSLINIVPPVQGDIDRRWGYALQTPSQHGSLASLAQVGVIGGYQNSLSNSKQIVVSEGLGRKIFATTEAGQVTNSNIYTPVSLNPTRMLNSRNYEYFASGAVADYKKWDGNVTTTNWGIDINSVAGLINGPDTPTSVLDLGAGGGAASAGPLNPGSAVSGGSVDSSSITTWAGTSNLTPPNGSAATTNLFFSNQTSLMLTMSGYGFNVPVGATVTGISVTRLGGYFTNGTGNVSDYSVRIRKAGVIVGNDHRQAAWTQNSTNRTYGNATDLWGTTWTPADINNPGFGVSLAVWSPTANGDGTHVAQAQVFSVTITVYYTIPVGGTWTNPNNVKVLDGNFATSLVSTSPTSILQTTGYGFSMASNVVQGIFVEVNCSTTIPGTLLNMQLMKNGNPYGKLKSVTLQSSTPIFVSLGGANDLWTGNWLYTDINNSGFGVQFYASVPGGTGTLSIDVVRITVYASVNGPQLGSPGVGAITLTVGRNYCIAFQNSTTGHISNITPFSLSTGPLTSQNQPLTGIAVSLDPQVDSKVILATADGGDETTLYFIASIPNSQSTYTDATPEATLLLNNVYANQDASGNEFGVLDNTPPPVESISPTKHRGRVYMVTPNNLYYSKSEGELVTSSGTLTGKYEEAWPPLNYFDVSSGAEVNRGLLSDGQVLYIGTNRRIVRLFGDGPATFTEPESLFNHTGIANQDVWQMVFVEGNPLGAMWLTPDHRVLGSDFNTYQDVGLPVQNVLDSINVTAFQQTAWATYVGISNWNLYVLAIPTGNNIQPDTLLIFDLKGKKWYTWLPSDVMLAGYYSVTLAGQPQFLTLDTPGNLDTWGPQYLQDRVGGTPVGFTMIIQSSWQDFTDAAARKYLNEIEVITGDPTMQVTIEGASQKSDFDAPHTVVANATLQVKPRGELFVPLAGLRTSDRFYRYTLGTGSTGTDLLRGINIQGSVIHRL